MKTKKFSEIKPGQFFYAVRQHTNECDSYNLCVCLKSTLTPDGYQYLCYDYEYNQMLWYCEWNIYTNIKTIPSGIILKVPQPC